MAQHLLQGLGRAWLVTSTALAGLSLGSDYTLRALTEPGSVQTPLPPISIDPHPSALYGVPFVPDVYKSYAMVGDADLTSLTTSVLFEGSSAFEGATVEAQQVTVPLGGGPDISATGWVSVGTVSGGRYSGHVTCPACTRDQQSHKEVRIVAQGVQTRLAAPHAVSHVVALVGSRSTFAMAINHFAYLNQGTPDPITAIPPRLFPGQTSVVTAATSPQGFAGIGGNAASYALRYGSLQAGDRINGNPLTLDSYWLLANQWGQFSERHVLFIDHLRVTGSSFPWMHQFAALYGQIGVSAAVAFFQAGHEDDGTANNAKRSRDDYPLTFAALGGAWGLTTANRRAIEEMCLQEAYYGGSRAADVPIIYQMFSRNTPTALANAAAFVGHSRYFGSRGDPVPVPDMRLQGSVSNSAHALAGDRMGTMRLTPTWARAAARAIGLDTSRNPRYGRSVFSEDMTEIWTEVVPMSGGTIYADNPDALRCFQTAEDGAGLGWGGVSTLEAGNRVKTVRVGGGAWSAATRIVNHNLLPNPVASGSGPGETELVRGHPRETLATDVLGLGLTVQGTSDESGQWIPFIDRQVEPYDASFFIT